MGEPSEAGARRSGKRVTARIARAIGGLALIFMAWCGLLAAMQDKIVFPGPPAGTIGDGSVPAGAERIWLGESERVEAWYFPAPGSSAASPAPAIIFFHGNGEVIDFNTDLARDYTSRGWSVLFPEYRGYGRSAGKPSQDAIVADAERAFDWLASRPDVRAGRIVLHGRSLGGAVAVQLAARRPAAAVIAQSTFTSVTSIARGMLVPAFLVRHPFRTDEALRSLDVPVLLFHGAEDTIVPVSHGRTLAAIGKRITYIEVRAGHNDLPRDEREYWDAIARFLGALN